MMQPRLEARGLSDSVVDWQEGDYELKKKTIMRAPAMLGKLLRPNLSRKAYQQMSEMEGSVLLQTMNIEHFMFFLNQIGHSNPKYRFGQTGDGSNV